jgi:hypothetical protein
VRALRFHLDRRDNRRHTKADTSRQPARFVQLSPDLGHRYGSGGLSSVSPSPVVCLVRHAAPAAKGLLRQKRQAVAERRGCDSDRNDEDEEPQYLQRTPSRFGRGVITNGTLTGKDVLFAAQAVGDNGIWNPTYRLGLSRSSGCSG